MHILEKPPHLEDLRKNHPLLKALIWDMDGTIVDSEGLHTKATYNLLKEMKSNYSIEETDHLVRGQVDQVIYSTLQRERHLGDLSIEQFMDKKDEHIKSMLTDSEVIAPLIRKCLEQTSKSSDLKLALVTSSEKDLAHYILKELQIYDLFDVVLCREDTPKNKPHPMPYLEAFKLLELNNEDVIIFEDSVVGHQAAVASGAFTYKVTWY